MYRKRFTYLLLIILAAASGLASRHFSPVLPVWVHLYLGDAIWAVAVYLFFAFVFNRTVPLKIAAGTLVISYLIEVSQLYHAPWIDAVRDTLAGGLILGFGFLWSDLLSYTAGIAFVFFLELLVYEKKTTDSIS